MLVTNPRSDVEFEHHAEQLSHGIETPEELEALLREQYDHARVVRGVTDIIERWYVYRDGRWVNSRDN
jgi:hypothetical protein